MKKLQLQVILFFILMSMPIVYLLASSVARIDYPHNFRNWVHVKSVLINEKHPLFVDFGGCEHDQKFGVFGNDAVIHRRQFHYVIFL